MMKHHFLPLAAALMCLLFAPSGMAKMYKWVDQNGVTQYTQFPPSNGQAEEMQIQTSKPSPDNATNADDGKVEKSVNTNSVATSEGKEEPTKSEGPSDPENCKTSQQNLQLLEINTRVRIEEGEGYRLLSPEERQQKIEQVKKQIEIFCN